MRLIFCLALVLSACSTANVRCDKHLHPINAPSAKMASNAVQGRLP